MQIRPMMELTALIAVHGGSIVRESHRLSENAIEQYWINSRSRCERWQHAMKRAAGAGDPTSPALDDGPLSGLAGTLEEIFTSEMLMRVFAAVACEFDRRRGHEAITPFIKSVLMGHLDARHRALCWLLDPRIRESKAADHLDRLRRRAERWTDMLLAHLIPDCEVDGLSFDSDRTLEFAEELMQRPPAIVGNTAWRLMLSSLTTAFRNPRDRPSPNADLNREIVACVIASFPAALLEINGELRAFWMERMERNAHQTQRWIDKLLILEGCVKA